MLVSQNRLVDECARVPPLGRLSARRRTALLQLAALAALLALGLVIGLTLMWALIAIPMVLIVLLFLMELERARGQAAATGVVDDLPVDSAQRDGSTGIVVRRRNERRRGLALRRSARASR